VLIVVGAIVLVVLWRTTRPSASADDDRVPAAGKVISDPLRSGGSAPAMVVIPRGTLRVSETDGDSRAAWMTRFTTALPRRMAVAQTETTVASFRRFVTATGTRIENGCWYHTVQQEWKLAKAASWSAPGFPQEDNHPVTCIAYEDARAYAAWLSAETNAPYRLPTELEFEFFNRAGHDGAYDVDVRQVTDLCGKANGADRSAQFAYAYPCVDGYEFTAPVGRFPANGFGLYDTTGNLWELTTDCWRSDSMRAAWHAVGFDSPPHIGSCHGRHVVRGGSFISSPANLQVAKREIEGYRSTRTGFRLVRDLP
jgi:sulfatase modifying factor 1